MNGDVLAVVCARCGCRGIPMSAASCPRCGAVYGWAQIDRRILILAAEQQRREDQARWQSALAARQIGRLR